MKSTAVAVITAVANELAEKAKSSMPELQNGEKILREWYKGGIYYRETNLRLCRYDFREKVVGFTPAA